LRAFELDIRQVTREFQTSLKDAGARKYAGVQHDLRSWRPLVFSDIAW